MLTAAPMALLDEIIEAATDDEVPIGTLLRKCLVLEQSNPNEKFRVWLDRELDGYEGMTNCPRIEPSTRSPTATS